MTGFGFGNDGGWEERLRIAAKWDLAAPIICSTNSWITPRRWGRSPGRFFRGKRSRRWNAGQVRPARLDTLWMSEGKGTLDTDHVQVDEVDYLYWRHIGDDKHKLHEITGQWPEQ